MLRKKIIRWGCLPLGLLALIGGVAFWAFIGHRAAKLAQFADENQPAVENVRVMMARAMRPADEATATTTGTSISATTASTATFTAPARGDGATSPGALAAALQRIERAVNLNDLRGCPLTQNMGELGRVTLGLPAGAAYFTRDADGRLTPTAETWRIIHEEVALAEGGWLCLRAKRAEQKRQENAAPATTGTQPVAAGKSVKRRGDIEKMAGRIREGLDLTAQLLDRPAPAVPEMGNWRTMPDFMLSYLAPAAVLRTSQREGPDAAERQLGRYLRLRYALDLSLFPSSSILRFGAEPALELPRLLIKLDAANRFTTATLVRLARQLDGLRLDERQLVDLRQAHVARLRQWMNDSFFDGGLVGYQGQSWNSVQKGARLASLSFFEACLQRGAVAWAGGDEAEYYRALAAVDRENTNAIYKHTIGPFKLFIYSITAEACPPELGAWNGAGAVNDNLDQARLLLAAIRFRRERGREPATLTDLAPAYLAGPEWRGTADSTWVVDRPGTTTVPLMPNPTGPPDEASSFAQAVVRFRKAERATPRSAEQLRRYAASPEEAQSFTARFALVPDRLRLCHFRRARLHRKDLPGFRRINGLSTDNHLPWGGPVRAALGPLADLGEVERPLRAGAEQVDYVAISVLWPQPELIGAEQIKAFAEPGPNEPLAIEGSKE